MNENLYYCKDWKHQSYKDYDIYVSDFVEDPEGVLLQIHCLVTRNNKVVRCNIKDVLELENHIKCISSLQ